MSELDITRGPATLSVRTNPHTGLASVEIARHDDLAYIELPRLEVLQLRDWLNEWLARTPL